MAENKEYTFDENEEYELIKEGDYEVVLEAEVKSSKKDSTVKYLNLTFRIRNDVEQPHIGRLLFEPVFRDKENPGTFRKTRLRKIVLTQKGKENYQNTFANDDELIQYLNGLTLQVHVICKEPDEWHDSAYNAIQYFSPSNVVFQEVGTSNTTPPKAKIEYVDVNDEDLPF